MVDAHEHCGHDHICWGGGHQHEGGHELRLEDVAAGYGGQKVIEGISLSITCGHTLALIGPNGAGKSTLLHALAGLRPILGGRILWNGAPLHDVRREIAFLPQRSEVDWNFPITVRRLVEMGRYPALGPWKPMGAHDRDIVDKALDALEMTHLQHRQIGELSGGQQQRAFLARAMAQEAHILLLDEPFGGLDVPGAASLGSLLRSLAQEGRLVVASHHDMATAAQVFDRALLMRKRALAYGETAEVLTPQNLQQIFPASERA